MDKSRIIHCIGDSHASFFAGFDYIQPGYPEKSLNKYKQFKAYRLGSVLAYSLGKYGTKEKGTESLFQLLDELPIGSKLLLCFGEIDNRCHLLKQSNLQRKPLDDIVVECVESYFLIIDKLLERGFEVLIFGALPSCESHNLEYPTYGTMKERNLSTKIFNKAIHAKCVDRKIHFFNLYKYLTTKEDLTKNEYFFDGVHLGQVAFPFLLNELSKNASYKSLFKTNKYSIVYKMFISIIKAKAESKIKIVKRRIKRLMNYENK